MAFARRVSFCTDDVTATDVLEKGHLDNVVRLAIKAGVEPMTAIQMATINSAEAYRIDDKVGSICPGRIADILFVDDLENFEVKEVMTNGKMVAKDHKLTYDLQAPERSSVLKGNRSVKSKQKKILNIRPSSRMAKQKFWAMDVKGPFVRKRRDVVLKVEETGIVFLIPSRM